MKLRNSRLSVIAASALAVAGIGTGIALGTSNAPAAPTTVQGAEPAAVGPDRDTLQQGDQTTPDSKAATEVGAAETPANETTTPETQASETAPEAVEAGEPTLPGGGHQDPAGQNVDHQFQGIE